MAINGYIINPDMPPVKKMYEEMQNRFEYQSNCEKGKYNRIIVSERNRRIKKDGGEALGDITKFFNRNRINGHTYPCNYSKVVCSPCNSSFYICQTLSFFVFLQL